MSIEGQKFYPGADATPGELATLAGEYQSAARTLRSTGRRGEPLSYWPYRLLAIHAVELYLSAFLREKGKPAATVRGLQHDLAERTESAQKLKLGLRKRTADHLRKLTESREYLVTRYDPTPEGVVSHLNRLEATLNEVAEKVEAVLIRK